MTLIIRTTTSKIKCCNERLPIPGCFLFIEPVTSDGRGRFNKTFHMPTLQKIGLYGSLSEVYITTSRKGVIRGLHFQSPPSECVKLVSCVSGAAMDVLVDLRAGSPMYGIAHSLYLHGSSGYILYLPCGIAHGFASLQDETRMLYMTGAPYSPDNDKGILWNSIGMDWEMELGNYLEKPKDFLDNAITSHRDQSFPRLDEFVSPFTFEMAK